MQEVGRSQNEGGGDLRTESCELEIVAGLSMSAPSTQRDQQNGASEPHVPTSSAPTALHAAAPSALSLNHSAICLFPIERSTRSRSSSLSSLTSLSSSDLDSDSDCGSDAGAKACSRLSSFRSTPSSISNFDADSDSDWESERTSRSFTRDSTPCSEEYGTPPSWRPFSAETRRIKSPSAPLSIRGKAAFAVVINQALRRPLKRRKPPRIRSVSPSSEEEEGVLSSDSGEEKPSARRSYKIPRLRSPSPSSEEEMALSSEEPEEKPLSRVAKRIPRIRSLSISSHEDETSSEGEEEVPLSAVARKARPQPSASALESSDEEERSLAPLLRTLAHPSQRPTTPSSFSPSYPMPKVGSVWSTRRALLHATLRASNEQGFGWRLISRHWSSMDIVGCGSTGAVHCPATAEIVPLQVELPEGRWVLKARVEHNHPPAEEALEDWKSPDYLSKEFNRRLREQDDEVREVKPEEEAERRIRVAPSLVSLASRRDTPIGEILYLSDSEEDRIRHLSIPSTPPPSKIKSEPISLSVLRHLFQQLRPSLLPLVDTLYDKGMREKDTVWDFFESPSKVLDEMKYGNEALRRIVLEETGKVRKELGWRAVADGDM